MGEMSIDEDNGEARAAGTLTMVGRTVSRTDLVVDAIRRAILDGSMAPGETLSERDVAARLGVSKTPVRDALKLLLLTGLVEMSPLQRMMVRRVDRALIAELYQTRGVLEPAAVGFALDSRPASPAPVAREALRQSQQAFADGDMAEVSLANRRFHRELYSGCGNRFLLQQLDQLQDLTALTATSGWARIPTSSREADEHRDILAAYEAGDRSLTVSLIDQHVGGALTALLAGAQG